MVNQQTVTGKKKAAVMAAVTLNTAAFGTLMEGVMGSNPFNSVAILSNLQVSAYVSTGDFTLPDPVALPAPFESTRDIKKGFCFDARLGAPTVPCKDPVCAMMKKIMAVGSLTARGCVNAIEMSLLIGVANVKFSDAVMLRTAGLTYTATALPPSVAFGAMAELEVKMKDVVTFRGSLGLKQAGPQTLLSFSFAVSGLIPAFGIPKLHMFDLILAAEVGVIGIVPTINRLTIGGGICFGPQNKCSALVSGHNEEELLQKAGHNEEEGLLMQVPRFTDYHEHLAMLQSRPKIRGAIAAKLYAGFGADGDVFFYAGVTAVTVADIAAAFVGESRLPSWMGKVGIEAYDQDACDEAGGN